MDATAAPRLLPVDDDHDTGGFWDAARRGRAGGADVQRLRCRAAPAARLLPHLRQLGRPLADGGRRGPGLLVDDGRRIRCTRPTRCPTRSCSSSSSDHPEVRLIGHLAGAPRARTRARRCGCASRSSTTASSCLSGSRCDGRRSEMEEADRELGLRDRPRVPEGARLGRRVRARGGRAARLRDPPRLGHERPGAPAAHPAAPGPRARARAVGDAPRPEPRRSGLRAGEAGAAERDPRAQPQRADRLRLPGARLRQRRDPRPLRQRAAEEASTSNRCFATTSSRPSP